MTEPTPLPFVEDVEVGGHVIDAFILPKVLDLITSHGGAFRIKEITIGQQRVDPSYALIEVSAPTAEKLKTVLAQISDHGAAPVEQNDCHLVEADLDGCFPEAFYSTTNQRTEVRLEGKWVPVADQEMDCGVVVEAGRPRCIPMTEVRRGQLLIVGHAGVRVFPEARTDEKRLFEFMGSAVSTEKPKRVAVRQVAEELFRAKHEQGRTLLVGGPAIIHTGSAGHVGGLIARGYINKLFAGNALATHDIEAALYGTSLGVALEQGLPVDEGHEHHLRAINTIRRLGGIKPAVEAGVLKSGVMYECVRHNVDYILCGSIRDDGPLPDVVTDALEGQRLMRAAIRDVTFCLMIATTLHSIAVGNLLPAWCKVVCVDINPSTVIKLADRGSFQTVGIVTDVEPFLRVLTAELDELERKHLAGSPQI